jgi:hypothetical protein
LHRQKEIQPYGGNGISWTIHLDKLTFWHLTPQQLAIPTNESNPPQALENDLFVVPLPTSDQILK